MKLMLSGNIMINPFYIFSIAIVGVIGIYSLGWSSLFPTLSFELISFLIMLLIVALILGFVFSKNQKIIFRPINGTNNLTKITILIFLVYCLSAVYSGGFPFINKIITSYDNRYTEFGLPTIHVFLVTFNSFFVTYLFHLFLSIDKNKKKRIGILIIINLLPSFLIINRAMLVIILMNMLFLYLIKIKGKIRGKHLIMLSVTVLIGLYIFGIFGNSRLHSSYNRTNVPMNNSDLVMWIGNATEEFQNSFIPDAFFWTYLYAASPLANLEYIMNVYQADINLDSFSILIINDLFPDFISNRLIPLLNIEISEPLLIVNEFTATTAFRSPYQILGWLGMVVFSVVLFMFGYLYINVLRKITHTYFLTGYVTICTLFTLVFFSNMLSFSGLSFQLVYPILFSRFFVGKT